MALASNTCTGSTWKSLSQHRAGHGCPNADEVPRSTRRTPPARSVPRSPPRPRPRSVPGPDSDIHGLLQRSAGGPPLDLGDYRHRGAAPEGCSQDGGAGTSPACRLKLAA